MTREVIQPIILTPAQRLIVAADFKPPAVEMTHRNSKRTLIEREVLDLADKLAGTGVILKVNSALRACGYHLIDEIHDRGLEVFADLKLNDIPETLTIDGLLLHEARPELVTVMCTTGVASIIALDEELPDTEVLGVTVLTSLTNNDTDLMFSCNTTEAVEKVSKAAHLAAIGGFISSGAELETLQNNFGLLFSYNTPAIRFEDNEIADDDQNPERVFTPRRAIMAGATRIVMGRGITQAKDPFEAVQRAISEIESGLQNVETNS